MRYILLIIPCIAALIAPFYNTVDPMLLGIPFLYWYLMLLIPVSSLFIWLAAKTGGDDV